MGWFYLFVAIIFEVIGTTYLKRAEGNVFSSAGMLMLLFYAISFGLLTLAIKTNQIEVGTGYAIWSGLGTALIAWIGVIMFNEHVSTMKVLCIAMIIIGVVGLKMDKPKRATENLAGTLTPVINKVNPADSRRAAATVGGPLGRQ